jgi:hypothetical protein
MPVRAEQARELVESSAEEEDSEVARDGVDEVATAPHSYRPEGIVTAVKSLTSTGKEKKGKKMTPNIQALAITAFLFTLITVVQVFAAKIAHSQALLMDCVSMGVDALTYMGNIFVECRKRDGVDHKGSQLIVCAISLSCLIFFTYSASLESIDIVKICRGDAAAGEEGEGEDVNGYITLAFGLGGVIFDFIALWSFYKANRKNGEARAVNMFTALLHVGADFLRSTSTVFMSLLILLGGFDSTCLDAYTSLFIGASITFGAAVGIFEWLKLLVQFVRGR